MSLLWVMVNLGHLCWYESFRLERSVTRILNVAYDLFGVKRKKISRGASPAGKNAADAVSRSVGHHILRWLSARHPLIDLKVTGKKQKRSTAPISGIIRLSLKSCP
jgi:hypothetical protein